MFFDTLAKGGGGDVGELYNFCEGRVCSIWGKGLSTDGHFLVIEYVDDPNG